MLFINGLSMQFGGEYLFDDVAFVINDRDRIGLTGANGAGKSTLLKIIVGEIEPEEGGIEKPAGFTVGYLPQDGLHFTGRTLLAEAKSAWVELEKIEQEIDRTQQLVSDHTEHESAEFLTLVHRLGDLHHEYDHMGGYAIESKIAAVLHGLGFQDSDMLRLTDEFSGGWQMRIALAKLLLNKPQLLLLDEPTNHLDIESLTWLEAWLQNYEGAIMMVSHDRRFLDSITVRTIEISAGEVYIYEGNYSTFLRLQAERRALMRSAFDNQQRRIQEIERFVERFRYKSTKSRQVQSRVKMLERMDKIEVEDEDRSKIHFTFPPASQSGVVPMDIRHATKYYDELCVFKDIDFRLERGDKVAFLGRNGEGKSTLAKIIAGIEPLTAGERVPGYNVQIAYFAQQQAEALDPDKTVFATVEDGATGEVRLKLRSLLGAFLFSGDDAFKPVRVLSGGEKSRLALAKMLLLAANVLVLDEPTNHLDMRSKAVLKEALQKYTGSFVVVSHDRDFLEGLVTKVVEFKDGKIKEYLGGVDAWLWKHEHANDAPAVEAAQKKEAKAFHKSKDAKKSGSAPKPDKKSGGDKNSDRVKRQKPVKDKIAKLEKSIAQTEERKTAVEEELAHPEVYKDGARAKKLNDEYATLGATLKDLYFKWGEAAEELDRLK